MSTHTHTHTHTLQHMDIAFWLSAFHSLSLCVRPMLCCSISSATTLLTQSQNIQYHTTRANADSCCWPEPQQGCGSGTRSVQHFGPGWNISKTKGGIPICVVQFGVDFCHFMLLILWFAWVSDSSGKTACTTSTFLHLTQWIKSVFQGFITPKYKLLLSIALCCGGQQGQGQTVWINSVYKINSHLTL